MSFKAVLNGIVSVFKKDEEKDEKKNLNDIILSIKNLDKEELKIIKENVIRVLDEKELVEEIISNANEVKMEIVSSTQQPVSTGLEMVNSEQIQIQNQVPNYEYTDQEYKKSR